MLHVSARGPVAVIILSGGNGSLSSSQPVALLPQDKDGQDTRGAVSRAAPRWAMAIFRQSWGFYRFLF